MKIYSTFNERAPIAEKIEKCPQNSHQGFNILIHLQDYVLEVEMEEDMKETLAALEDSLAEHRTQETEEGRQHRYHQIG